MRSCASRFVVVVCAFRSACAHRFFVRRFNWALCAAAIVVQTVHADHSDVGERCAGPPRAQDAVSHTRARAPIYAWHREPGAVSALCSALVCGAILVLRCTSLCALLTFVARACVRARLLLWPTNSQTGQNSAADLRERDLKAELDERERQAANAKLRPEERKPYIYRVFGSMILLG